MRSAIVRAGRRLKLAVGALVVASYATLATTEVHPSAYILIPLVALTFMPMTERVDRRYPAFRAATRWLTLVTISFMAVLFLAFLRVYGLQSALVRSVMMLVMYIQIYSLVHGKETQNYYHIVLMSFFLLLVALVSDPTPNIGLSLSFFLIAMAASLVTLESYAAQIDSARTPPAAIVGLNEKELPREHLRSWPLELLSGSWLFASTLSIFLLATTFFLITPRTEIGLLGGLDTTNAFETGLSAEVDLAGGGRIIEDTSIVMRVVFPDLPDGYFEGPMFWRATTFNRYTGKGWAREDLRWIGSRFSPYARRFAVVSGPRGSHEGVHRIDMDKRPTIKQQIFLDQPSPTGLPVLSMPRTVVPDDQSGAYRMAWDPTGDFTVLVSPPGRSGFSYTVWSFADGPTPEELRDAPARFKLIVRDGDYRLLTGHNLLPETVRIVEEVTADAPTAYEKIIAVQNWLTQGEFTYTLNVPELPEDHPIDEFIQNVKTGHCELYASAMALMVRSLGIPARVVSGYRGGTPAPDGSYFVSADMAHLWVEIFFPEYGWITFDPSPERETVGQTALGSIVEIYARYALRLRLFWLRNVVGFTAEDRLQVFDGISIGALISGAGGSAGTSDASGRGGIVMVGPRPGTVVQVAGLCVGFLTCFVLFRLYREGRAPYVLSPDQKRAVRLYALISRGGTRLGVDVQGLSAEELGSAIADRRPGDRARADEAVAEYNAARFGARPLSRDRYEALRARVKSIGVREG